MQGYLLSVLDNDSQPTEYWSDAGFKGDIMEARIYADPQEAISNFAGLQARYNTVEMKVYKCRSVIEIIPGNPFAEVEDVEEGTIEEVEKAKQYV